MTISKRTVEESYLNLAKTWAEDRSKAMRKKVGAIIVKNGDQIISDGYNGTPHGFDNVCEDIHGNTKPEVLHAESNALMKLARNGGPGCEGAVVYQTLSPCYECAKLLIQSRISAVYYIETYRDVSGLELLAEANIPTIKMEVK